MPIDQPVAGIVQALEQRRRGLSPQEQAFIDDLVKAVMLREGKPGLSWAPYLTQQLGTRVISPVPFPSSPLQGYGPSFALLIRPLGGSEMWYGAPVFVDDAVSLSDSGIFDRKLERFRIGKKFGDATDSLTAKVQERYGRGARVDQDLPVEMKIGDLLAVYEKEEDVKLGAYFPIRVRRLTVVIPTNPRYQTEAVGFVKQRGLRSTDAMCFGYGIGDTFYRGRPVLQNDQEGPQLSDINPEGNTAYFDITALSHVSGEDAANMQVGNMVVLAIPIVGEVPRPLPYESSDMLTLGGGGMMRGLDLAAFSTGRETGTETRRVSGQYDPARPWSMIDARILALTPERMEEYVRVQ